ncbi:MAG: biotin--[acetyl-CoA-carboxylase] ligase [Bacteroidales bacterium]|nr:biotin--[acetyl-CoA-carboxylase] ligase [Bacteroidales bacterium]
MNTNYKIIELPEVDSTNNYAHNLLEATSDSSLCNTIVLADYQTAGRGAYQNSWESKKNENLTFSIIFCPQIEAKNQFIISKMVSFSLINYLKNLKIDAQIKWPNDILVNKKKIAGILIENSIIGSKISDSIIGIGFNINQLEFGNELNATSLSLEKKVLFDVKKELDVFLTFFDELKFYCSEKNYNFINLEYMNYLLGKDDYLRYRDSNGEFDAKIHEIDEFGRLIVKLKTGEQRKFGFKEVELVL